MRPFFRVDALGRYFGLLSGFSDLLPTYVQSRLISDRGGIEVCRKCAVRFEPICANTGFSLLQ
ncbi:MAG: hypothetical protein JWN45_656 [Acidobacteriaceae bacterium]|nr:hypothetical protein [Acidobacteriaceae bacterium]